MSNIPPRPWYQDPADYEARNLCKKTCGDAPPDPTVSWYMNLSDEQKKNFEHNQVCPTICDKLRYVPPKGTNEHFDEESVRLPNMNYIEKSINNNIAMYGVIIIILLIFIIYLICYKK